MEKNRGWWKKNIFQQLCVPLAEPVELGQTLPVYFTACSGSYSSVCSQWSGSESFILNSDSNKEIHQCLVHGSFGTF